MSACKYCGADIVWQTIAGRPVPHNPAGDRHACLRPTLDGASPSPGMRRRAAPRTSVGARVVGANYAPPACGGCAVPPWEICACSAQLAA